MRHSIRLILLLAFGFTLFAFVSHAEVQIVEKTLRIPTYPVGPADKTPRFYDGRTYQGAQGRIYPYPISDTLNTQIVDQDYQAVYLENEYIQICVLPEIGGRIFSALDKTNNYDFFYRQQVIKPALIGMLGAWISGGIEWNYPHHHRANTFMPMDYTIAENSDGSKTLWLTEIERRHRTQLVVGLTLYPGKSILEATIKIYNRTPMVHSFLYWANPAVHVDDTYQVLFAPENEYVVQHAKNEFASWPIANGRYGGRQYDNVDISWWKNLTKAVSFFCWDESNDFFAGYNHGKEAGVAYVSNHHISPGKKFFTFGCGDEGKMWDKRLTDQDGPYLELMAGGFSDNQPDYSWIQPYETKVVKQIWYPIRDLKGMEYANEKAAIHTETKGNELHVWLNSIQAYENANLVLKAGDTTLEAPCAVSPASPFATVFQSPNPIPDSFSLTLVDEKGKPILHYVPVQRPGNPKPQTVTPPGEPKEFKSNEELYLAGLRLNEFYNTKLDPNTYYNEVLSRDPNDSRVNTQLGILAIQGGRFDEAEGYLRRAVERITYNYTRPRDCDAHYFLGLALRYLGRTDEAYDQFFRASWDLAWRSAAYYQLAELDCGAGAYESALENITHSIETNTLNPKAWNLKATIQRHLGLTEAARITLSHLKTLVPIDYWTLNEMVLHQVQGSEETLKKGLPRDIELVLELATDYGNAGFLHDAIAILQQHGGTTHPMPQYYLSYYNHILGKVPETQAALIQAAKASPDYVFPYRLETIAVLHHAMRLNPSDALAPYYLGNLLFDSQPETAKALWQDAMAKNPAFAMAHRNLGYAIAREGENLPQAVALYEKAIVADPQNARLFYELDRLYESANRDPQERLALLTRNEAVIATRDDAMARLVSLQIRLGDYSDAIHTLTHRHFFTWEGGGEIHNDFIDAHLCRGIAFLHQNQPRKAALDFLMANEYPENLEVGRPLTDPNAIRTFYFVGLAKQTMGETEAAMDCFQRALAIEGWRADTLFYKGLAQRALENEAEAAKAFERLLQDSQKRLTSSGETDFFAKFGEQQSHNNRLADAHYLSGLAYLGQNQFGQAQQQFAEALKLNSNHLWASVFSAYSATIVPKGEEK